MENTIISELSRDLNLTQENLMELLSNRCHLIEFRNTLGTSKEDQEVKTHVDEILLTISRTTKDLFLKDQIGYNVLLSRFSYIKSMYSALKIGGRFPLNLNLDFI